MKRFVTNFACGVEVNFLDNYQVSATFFQGLGNASKKEDITSKSNGFCLGIAYIF